METMTWRQDMVRGLGSAVLSAQQRDHVRRVRVADAGHGWDRFGMSARGVEVGLCVTRHLYDYYFRVQSYGTENVPSEGAALLAANHSGMVPIDAFMLYADVLLNTDPPRVARPIADFFVPELPFLNILFTRGGMISGSRGNVHASLDDGDLLQVFPEGTRGVGKGWEKRYQLQRWSVGHAELAIRHQAPIVPVGIVGAEEAWPQIAKIEGLRAFGIPYLPVPATPLPMPARFHIHYGKAIDVADEYEVEQANDPKALGELAARVREAVSGLLERGRLQRRGVFS
jgi:1-acyl-sn-glycerol-3-phosphate acyltransferase